VKLKRRASGGRAGLRQASEPLANWTWAIFWSGAREVRAPGKNLLTATSASWEVSCRLSWVFSSSWAPFFDSGGAVAAFGYALLARY